MDQKQLTLFGNVVEAEETKEGHIRQPIKTQLKK